MRPIRPSDAERLVDFHRRLSADSIYRRYFSLHSELSPDEVAHLTTVDYRERLALVVVEDEALVAVGRFDRYPDSTTAEVAFVVLDSHQHQGLGLALLERLADAAWARGVEAFTASTLATNRDMLAVFYDSGFVVEVVHDAEEIEVRFALEPTSAVRARRAERRDRSG
ncbi:MAG: GNAT family N-acetyltransferase, partial [Acidimicrobiales bacterium]